MKEYLITCKDFSYQELFTNENEAWKKAREISKNTYGYVQISYIENGIDEAEYCIYQELPPKLRKKVAGSL